VVCAPYPHFFSLHAMQIVPLVGWLVGRYLSRRLAFVSVLTFASLYAAFTTFTFLQALAGHPFA